MPEADTFLHGVTQLAGALHQGTGPEERWQKRSSIFFQGKLRRVAQAALLCGNQVVNYICLTFCQREESPWPLALFAALVWVSQQECACFFYILQSLAVPLVRLAGSEVVREDGIE